MILICWMLGHVGARFALSGCYVCHRCHHFIVLPWAGGVHAQHINMKRRSAGEAPR